MSPSNFTILFAEDNPQIMRLYQKSFAQDGYKVLVSTNAAEAMAELQAEKVDLLVTDLVMPEANTFDLFHLLKEKFPKIPVIIVSGKYQDLKDDFLNKGYKVAAFIQKPVELAVLKAKVAETLGIEPAGTQK
jgi:CheY-like chemotaxis protein